VAHGLNEIVIAKVNRQGSGETNHEAPQTGYFEEVAAIAARLKRWEFMVSWATMQVPNGTASPFTALATF
jgi:hypothetical protein